MKRIWECDRIHLITFIREGVGTATKRLCFLSLLRRYGESPHCEDSGCKFNNMEEVLWLHFYRKGGNKSVPSIFFILYYIVLFLLCPTSFICACLRLYLYRPHSPFILNNVFIFGYISNAFKHAILTAVHTSQMCILNYVAISTCQSVNMTGSVVLWTYCISSVCLCKVGYLKAMHLCCYVRMDGD